MKIETNVEIGEASKALMIANKIPIPKPFLTFEMSPEKAHIFANEYASGRKLIVNEDKIYVENFYIKTPDTKWVQNGIDSKDGQISSWKHDVGKSISLGSTLYQDLISGVLKEGMNIDTYLEKIEAQIVENQKLFDDAQKELDEFEAHAPQREAAKQAYEVEKEKLRLEKEAKEAEEKAKEEEEKRRKVAEEQVKRQARLAWAQEHGSERLRKGLEQGYACTKLYETEFGEYLIADDGYKYDRDQKVEVKDRSCPGLEALTEVERINQINGLSAIVVWLPEGLGELYRHPDEFFEPESGCEAVRIDVKGTSGYWYKRF